MNWERVRLTEICNPKQWKTISMSELKEEGYPVYGANGKIGYYDKYNHEKPTLLIGCRGTCGAVHISEPYSYTNGNTMALDNLSEDVDIKFLYYHFLYRGFDDVLSGGVQKQITGIGLSQIEIPLPPLSVQKEIVEKLDKATAIREKSKALLAHYDALAESLFIELFGDPISNEKGWEISTFGAEFKISSGGTPKTNIGEYWEGGNIPWIGSNMCKDEIIYQNDGKFITQKGLENSSTKIFKVNSVLVALVGATIGKTALLKFDTAINQNIAGIVVSNKFNSYFVFYCLRNLYGKFLELGEGSFKMANLSFVRNLEIPLPPLSLQIKFAEMVENIEEQKARAKAEIEQSEAVFQALLQESFG